jgi:hypothetical protein
MRGRAGDVQTGQEAEEGVLRYWTNWRRWDGNMPACRWLLEAIIEPVFEAHFQDFIVTRSDKISAPGSISSQIINVLHTAELVIADMSRENANDFHAPAAKRSTIATPSPE